MSDVEIPEDFIIEATELFDDAEDKLLSLSKGTSFKDCYNSVFRAFHSVKGAAGMFDLVDLQKHMHHLEDLFEANKQEASLSDVKIDFFLRGIDGARKILDGESIEFEYTIGEEKPAASKTPAVAATPVSTPQAASDKVEAPPVQNKVAPVVASAESSVKEKSKKGLIYVVDDEVSIVNYIQSLLEENDYSVRTFNNPLDVEACLLSSPKTEPDAVISDFKMPKMTGVELMNKTYQVRPLLPFILVTGFLNKDVALDAIATGVTSIFEKPFDEEKFLLSVEIAVKRYRAVKLFNKSLDIILYQFSDLEDFLLAHNKNSVCDMLRNEMKYILDQKKIILGKG